VYDIAFETAESVYAVMETAVYQSTNGGQSWVTIGAPPEAKSLHRLLLRDGTPMVSGADGVWQHVGLWKQLLINSTFESVDSWTLPSTSTPAAYSDVQTHTGLFAMRIGLTETMTQTYGYSSARQTVTLPDDLLAARLHVWLYPIAENAITAGDLHYILLLDPTDNAVLATLYWDLSNEQAWQEMAFPSPSSLAGREVVLLFGVKNDGINGRSALYVDDASLWVLDGALLPHRLYLPLVLGG
jgi:hypothetical protein